MSLLLFPEWLPVEKWQAWKRMRLRLEKVKKVPFTEDCERIAINRLGRYHAEGYDVGHVLEESTWKGWAGLFVDERTPRKVPERGPTLLEPLSPKLQAVKDQLDRREREYWEQKRKKRA